jgi:murein DD-endopeptidase MepM/ murein hydrolase activator NlpD
VKLGIPILTAPSLLLVFLLGALFAGCSAPGIYHPVQPGETLGQIARAYGRSETQLARVNGISAPQPLQKGERLFIPGATSLRRTTVAPPGATQSSPASERAETTLVPSPPLTKKLQGKDAALRNKAETQVVKSFPPEVVRGRFSWPLQGELLRRFGDQNPFPCKGIEIAAPAGTPVLAAAAGRVIYSGDGISSFGNMIILRHDGDFYTVYAFAQKNFAKVGSFVSQNERIALSGVPPQGRSPRLYFELRYHKEPVNPTFYLP